MHVLTVLYHLGASKLIILLNELKVPNGTFFIAKFNVNKIDKRASILQKIANKKEL